jgi:hypothetical protein
MQMVNELTGIYQTILNYKLFYMEVFTMFSDAGQKLKKKNKTY